MKKGSKMFFKFSIRKVVLISVAALILIAVISQFWPLIEGLKARSNKAATARRNTAKMPTRQAGSTALPKAALPTAVAAAAPSKDTTPYPSSYALPATTPYTSSYALPATTPYPSSYAATPTGQLKRTLNTVSPYPSQMSYATAMPASQKKVGLAKKKDNKPKGNRNKKVPTKL